jgi:hypothetical protein
MKVIELLDKAKHSPVVAFHKFVLLTKKHENDLFCFFEGYDSPYYSSRIKTFTSKNYHPIICGNKKSVISVKEKLEKDSVYQKYKTLFFIDRDFDETLSSTSRNLYETPCYSVENFYVSLSSFSEILKNEFHLTEEEVEYKTAIELFKENQTSFHDASLFFNGWYALQKEKCRLEKCKLNICLNEKLPKGFIILKIGSISKNYELIDIEQKFPDAIKVSEDDINNKIMKLKEVSLEKSLRGKYEIWFLYEMLRYLIDDANNSKKRTILKAKTKFNIDKAQILSQLSQYADTPDCLIKFLEQWN